LIGPCNCYALRQATRRVTQLYDHLLAPLGLWATYDYNSYHHIGAWPEIPGPLRAGDVALGYGAQAKYHVQPGQHFTDEYGRTWRFADRSGSKDPYNVDVFKGATGESQTNGAFLAWRGRARSGDPAETNTALNGTSGNRFQ
jgi:hypothetical protein